MSYLASKILPSKAKPLQHYKVEKFENIVENILKIYESYSKIELTNIK